MRVAAGRSVQQARTITVTYVKIFQIYVCVCVCSVLPIEAHACVSCVPALLERIEAHHAVNYAYIIQAVRYTYITGSTLHTCNNATGSTLRIYNIYTHV